jgi:hypothetical protein
LVLIFIIYWVIVSIFLYYISNMFTSKQIRNIAVLQIVQAVELVSVHSEGTKQNDGVRQMNVDDATPLAVATPAVLALEDHYTTT